MKIKIKKLNIFICLIQLKVLTQIQAYKYTYLIKQFKYLTMSDHNPNNQLDFYLHKHYHYHYYNKESLHHSKSSIKNRVTSPVNMVTPKRTHENNSGILPTKSNWKSKLNPQIGQIYQQINNNNKKEKQICSNLLSKEQQHTQNVQKLSNTGLSLFFQQQKSIKNIKNPLNSRKQEILKQIKQYQEYLKSVSRPNLYIPKCERIKILLNTKREQFKEQYQDKKYPYSTSTLASLGEQQQLVEIGQNHNKKQQQQVNKIRGIKNRLYDNKMTIMTRSGLKMLSTTATMNEIIINNNNDDGVNKISEFVQTKEQKGMSEQYSSLLQQLQKQSSQLLLLSTPSNNNNNNIYSHHDQNEVDKDNKQHYSYNLMRQQCGYLRDKFISHISTTDRKCK